MDSKLSKAQRQFNRLVRQIERFQQELSRENQRLDELVEVYVSEIHPVEREISCVRRKILLSLHARVFESPQHDKRSRNSFLKMLKEQLLEHWEELDTQIDDEFKRMFQSAMNCTPEEFQKRQSSEIRTEMEREFHEMGVDVDLSGIGPSADPEEVHRTLDEIDRKIASQKNARDPHDTSANSRRAQAEAERQRMAEEMRNKDLSSLYKQLAKLLHPDLEQDPQRRLAKETAMKQLNAAHAAHDLHAMLKMEIEWITQEGTDASRLSDEKLMVYNSALEEQVDELERMLNTVWMHPRFVCLARFAHPLFGFLGVEPRDMQGEVQSTLESLRASLDILSRDPTPKELKWLTLQLGPVRQDQGWDSFGF